MSDDTFTINFEQELEHFKPSLEAEVAINRLVCLRRLMVSRLREKTLSLME